MEKYNQMLPQLEQEVKQTGPMSLSSKRGMYEVFEDAALIKLDIQATIKRRIMRFMVAGFIILIENSLQMTIFYDDQLTVGNSWTWYLSAAPMLSNVLYSKWCGTIAPALYYIFQDHKYAIKIYYFGLSLGAMLCGSIQLLMKYQMEKHFVPEQPAYIHLMRNHNEVNYIFLFLVYSLFGGVILYIVYKFISIRQKNKEEEQS